MKIILTILLVALTAVNSGPMSGKDNAISPAEQAALKTFRELVGPLPQPYMNTDGYLMNWIRASEDNNGDHKVIRDGAYFKYIVGPAFDLQKAAKNLEKTLTWRKENNIDEILSEDFSDLKKDYPFDLSKKDKNGQPVFAIEYSNWDIKKGVEATGPRRVRFIRYLDYMLESAAAMARELHTTGYTYLVNVAGFDVDTHACPKCLDLLKYYHQHFETHYPYMTKNNLQVNAPKEYDSVHKLISDNQNPNTNKAFKVYDNNTKVWLKKVGKIVSIDQIPNQYIDGTGTPTTSKTRKPIKVYPWANTCAGCQIPGR